MINNRQNGNGRRRGRSGNAPRPNGGGGQIDRGSRLDNRARGNASQLHEKYKALAADAQRQGDRVMTEYYLQFADHYFRVLSENRSRFEDQQQPRRERFDGQNDDFDEGEGEPSGESFEERPAERAQRGQEWDRGEGEGNRDGYRERNRNDGARNDAGRGDGGRPDGNRHEGRADRGEGNRADRQRGEGMRGLEGPRADAGRESAERSDDREPRRPREGFEQREQRPRRERAPEAFAPPVQAEQAEPASAAVDELPLDAPVAERRPRGRPRKVVAPVGEESERIEMDRLPPAFAAEPAGDAAPAEAKPRRPRRPRGEVASA